MTRPLAASVLAVLTGIAAVVLVASEPEAALVLMLICTVAAMYTLDRLARCDGRTNAIAVPCLFAVLVLVLWQVLVRGLAVPMVLLPAPSDIGVALWQTAPVLMLDVVSTVLYAAIPGFVVGTGGGFLMAIAVDRTPFLQRGLMPLSHFASVIPIVGAAPIMIMWFGLGWASKAATVVLITLFPAFVNMLAGLHQASAIERDMMTSYAASYWQTMRKLRLPAALPFLFAAFKVNAALALIAAIVAEFFGSPLFGLGLRISIEIGHLAVDRVWAAIVAAAVVGSLAYGLLTAAERAATFWHPSQSPGRGRL